MSDINPFGPLLPSQGHLAPDRIRRTEEAPVCPTCHEEKLALIECHTCACITCHKCCRGCQSHGERMT